MVLVCAEIGTVVDISGQQCGSIIGQFGREQTCPKCGASEYSSFRSSTSDEIGALGFRPGDYC
jgi:hypothetical protein